MSESNGGGIPAQLPSGPVRGARPAVVTRANGAATLSPRTFDEVWNLASMLAASQFVPKAFAGKPGDVLAALMMGAEVGLAPMAALRGIAVINGRPSLWGDALLAVVMQHPDCVSVKEGVTGTDESTWAATCTVVRRGHEPHTVTFAVADAKRAKLWGKQGPWTEYPRRMLAMRARAFACRDKFADALAGLVSAEESEDLMTVDVAAPLAPEPGTGRRKVIALPQRAPAEVLTQAPPEAAPVAVEREPQAPAQAEAPPPESGRPTLAQLRAECLTALGQLGASDATAFLAEFATRAEDDAARTLTSTQAVQACRYTQPLVALRDALAQFHGEPGADG